MAKRLELDALINTDEAPLQGEVQQRGAGGPAPKPKAPCRPKKSAAAERPAEEKPTPGPSKRLSLTLDAETYRRLRLLAVETDRTHQAILEEAARTYLRKQGRT